jgi:peroxiredoxin-like protein
MDPKPYVVEAEWTGDRGGRVEVEGVKHLDFSAPPEFGGKEGFWTPEHLFLASVTTCYISTFSAISEINRFRFRGLRVSAEAALEKVPGGFRFAKVTIRPRLTIDDDQLEPQAALLLEKSKKACIVSRSVSAEVVMEPAIIYCDKQHVPELVSS